MSVIEPQKNPSICDTTSSLAQQQSAMAPSNPLSQSKAESSLIDTVLERGSFASGIFGISGDTWSWAAPRASLGTAGQLIGDFGEHLSGASLLTGVAINVVQGSIAAANGDYASVAYKGVDTVVDVGLARLGPAGGATSFAYDEIGGSKNLMWGARYAAMTQAYMGMAQMCMWRGH